VSRRERTQRGLLSPALFLARRHHPPSGVHCMTVSALDGRRAVSILILEDERDTADSLGRFLRIGCGYKAPPRWTVARVSGWRSRTSRKWSSATSGCRRRTGPAGRSRRTVVLLPEPQCRHRACRAEDHRQGSCVGSETGYLRRDRAGETKPGLDWAGDIRVLTEVVRLPARRADHIGVQAWHGTPHDSAIAR
jgi:hypothetical protein